MTTTSNIERLRRDDGSFPAYTSHGSYTILYVAQDGEVLCAACVSGKNGSCVGDPDVDGDPQWTIVAADGYWEGPVLQCAHCNTDIESSYGEVEAEPE